MFDVLDNPRGKNSIILLMFSILLIFVSGIIFGILHYTMATAEVAFENSDCTIENNVYVSSCQDLWDLAIFPFLDLRSILVWGSFFYIFGITLSMLLIGYQSGKNPVLLGLLVLFYPY